jgi:hypothetical protein
VVGWWDSSGAFVLYGVVAGAALSGAASVLANRHAARLATADRESRAQEAELDRTDERALDNERATRTMRERAYPAFVETVLQIVDTVRDEAARAKAGEPPLAVTYSPAEFRKGFSSVTVFGSAKTVELWNELVELALESHRAIANLRAANDPDRSLNLEAVSLAVDALRVRQHALYASLRGDLGLPE